MFSRLLNFSLVGKAAVWLVAHLAKAIRRDARKRVVVMLQFQLGDTLLWLDSARRLRRLYPQNAYEIWIIENPLFRQFSELCPYWDRVVDIGRSDLAAKLVLFRTLASADLFIDPRTVRDLSAIAPFIGAKEKIAIKLDGRGYAGMNCQQKAQIENAHFNQLLDIDCNMHSTMIYSRFLDLLGAEKSPLALDNLAFIPDIKPPFSDYLLVAPGANDHVRCWEPWKFAALADFLSARFQPGKIIFCGTKSDQPIATAVIALMKNRKEVMNLCGQTTLIEFFNLVKHAMLALSNDSGTSHVAALYGTPSLCIVGCGQPIHENGGLFHPYPDELRKRGAGLAICKARDCQDCYWHCRYAAPHLVTYPCIADISVEDALDKINANKEWREIVQGRTISSSNRKESASR